MPFAPESTLPGPATTMTYSTPSHADLAAVAATVSVVGLLMALLITWLAVRLRSTARSQPPIAARRPASTISYVFRPSDASSRFTFIRKPLRLSHRQREGSWDFADPDPFHPQKESPLDPPSQKRPAPLSAVPPYTPRAYRASSHKDEWDPRTPTTPTTVELPPPAYCRESVHQPKHLSLA